jgi:hypothetical protein
MSALTLHNALHSSERVASSTPASSTAQLARSVSTATFQTAASTRALLRPDASASRGEPRTDNAPVQDTSLGLFGDLPTLDEERDRLQAMVKKRLKRLRVAKGALEVVIGTSLSIF